ncbi:hypothetical protein [Arthrobacter sp. CJ23]|uniref:hypothetical protein n=1 Tax=Arthrobacter sp. CJ23 TaxID=2972479 RepID=UPI00215C0FC5|nr:hypothetical protein [Arthrobacter sp. CJ23]UVJ37991.1 hypothetical protein NVV90_12010 [Arthrobacter sp. CJ23]
MDELIKQGQWWWPFLVPVATGILAVAGSWFGTKLGKTTEHDQWLRNQKIEAYTNVLRQVHASVNSLDARHHNLEPASSQHKDITDTTNARLLIVASDEVTTYLNVNQYSLRRALEAVKTDGYENERSVLTQSVARLQESIRKDLGVIEKQALRHTIRFMFYEYLVYPWQDHFHRRYLEKHGFRWSERKERHPRYIKRYLRRIKRQELRQVS